MNFRKMLKRRLPKPLVTAVQKVLYTRQIARLADNSHPDFIGMSHLITRGDVVFDIGANMGIYTKFLSHAVGPDGTVYSMEPIPTTFDVLSYMTRKLHLGNVKLLNIAASDMHGTVTMEIPTSASGEENLYEARIPEVGMNRNLHTVSVETRTLDELLPKGVSRVSFLKCDVEGHELHCLKGARSIIERWEPAWLIEIWGDLDNQESDGTKTVNFLRQLGYELFVFDGEIFRPKRHGERDINYFFLTEKHLGHLRRNHLLKETRVHATN